ncbi:MAG: serpin family protein [Candidatus Marinimicrobia bacterium]|nr:serpin family protein [Candidatus Neomarinimicrobiota bacterium]
MYQRHYYAYSETEDHQVLDLEYKGGEYVMTVILPRETGGIGELSGTPGAELLARHDTLKQRKDVLVYLPKFRMETKYELSPFLSGLGIKTAFTPAADFSGMTGGKDLMISAVLHKAFIEVDEKKTEAAAATSVVMRLTAMPPAPEAPVEFRADHPFMFVIRHRDDKAVLFIGHLIEPEAS